jgi:hypothetical protein
MQRCMTTFHCYQINKGRREPPTDSAMLARKLIDCPTRNRDNGTWR